MSALQTRSPAPRANTGNRAEVNRNEAAHTILATDLEVDFAALFIARRYRIAEPLARAVVALAGLGRLFA